MIPQGRVSANPPLVTPHNDDQLVGEITALKNRYIVVYTAETCAIKSSFFFLSLHARVPQRKRVVEQTRYK